MEFLYMIKEGDTLEEIASIYGINVSEILAINEIERSQFLTGRIIILQQRDGIRYTVKPFDTLEKIAVKFKINSSTIATHNNIKEVFLGELIYIPVVK